MDAKELEAFLILKYGTVEAAMMAWLSAEVELNDEEEKLMAAYSKLYWPNLDLINVRKG